MPAFCAGNSHPGSPSADIELCVPTNATASSVRPHNAALPLHLPTRTGSASVALSENASAPTATRSAPAPTTTRRGENLGAEPDASAAAGDAAAPREVAAPDDDALP